MVKPDISHPLDANDAETRSRTEPVFSLWSYNVLSTSHTAPLQWPLERFGIQSLWASSGTRGEGVRVAVIDTGVNVSHPDLKHVIAHDYTGMGCDDKQGHGSHCCGIIGATALKGVRGVAPMCELHSFRVFDDNGKCNTQWIMNALQDIKSEKFGRFDVISMSLGSEYPYEKMRMLLLEMTAKGHLVVAAAGNDGSHIYAPHRRFGTVGYPADFLSTVAVGSTNSGGKRSSFSSTGNKLIVTAPGEEITSCWIGETRYATISGTSMACPFVAGCLAILVSYAARRNLPKPRQDTVLYALAASSTDLEDPGYDVNTGFGDIHPTKLLSSYRSLFK